MEALKRYAPRTASSVDRETPMELDAMRAKEEDEEEYEEDSEEEVDDALFFMEPKKRLKSDNNTPYGPLETSSKSRPQRNNYIRPVTIITLL